MVAAAGWNYFFVLPIKDWQIYVLLCIYAACITLYGVIQSVIDHMISMHVIYMAQANAI